jgi:hypothetical protein
MATSAVVTGAAGAAQRREWRKKEESKVEGGRERRDNSMKYNLLGECYHMANRVCEKAFGGNPDIKLGSRSGTVGVASWQRGRGG